MVSTQQMLAKKSKSFISLLKARGYIREKNFLKINWAISYWNSYLVTFVREKENGIVLLINLLKNNTKSK